MHRFRVRVNKNVQTTPNPPHRMVRALGRVDPVSGAPFRKDGLLRRVRPFATVAILAELSLALPPGPVSTRDTVVSAVLFVVAFVGCLLP